MEEMKAGSTGPPVQLTQLLTTYTILNSVCIGSRNMLVAINNDINALNTVCLKCLDELPSIPFK